MSYLVIPENDQINSEDDIVQLSKLDMIHYYDPDISLSIELSKVWGKL